MRAAPVFITACILLLTSMSSHAQSKELMAIEKSAAALGGKDRILGLKTISIYGYSRGPLHEGGANIDANPNAPMMRTNTADVERSINLERGQMRLQQRRVQDYTFQIAPGYYGLNREDLIYDGKIPYNRSPEGQLLRAPDSQARERRIEMLNNPISILRKSFDPKTQLRNLRNQAGLLLIDIKTDVGDELTLAINAKNNRPEWLSWAAPHENLGDVVYRTTYTGYQPESGVWLPLGYQTRIDWRDVVTREFYVTGYRLDEPMADMSAPPIVQSISGEVALKAAAVPIAEGIWHIKGQGGVNSVLIEFADHLTLYEVPSSQKWTKLVMQTARATVPTKPLTEAIVSHHHFDHSGGLRAAVAEGLTIITDETNVGIFRDIAMRPAVKFPDSQGANPRPIKIVGVRDHLKLKDSAREIDLYHAISNVHMAGAIFGYSPKEKLIMQGDMFERSWDLNWWGDHYMENIRYRNIEVERDVPIHGEVTTLSDLLKRVAEVTANTKALCEKAEKASFWPPGCSFFPTNITQIPE